jgi:hypothetical protein
MAMSFQALSLFPANGSDVNFRAWGSAISAAIAAVGLVQTSDTGQINWTTVSTPNNINQSRGYEIWKFNDALQATRPVFIRLDYGSGPYDLPNPQMWLTIGTATNGAGTITANASFPGSFHAQRTIFTTTSTPWYASGSAKSPFYVSSDGAGSLQLGGWMNFPTSNSPSYAGGFLLAERTRDWDGTPNGEGVLTITHWSTGTPTTQTLIIANSATYTQGGNWSGVPVLAGGVVSLLPKTGMVGSGVINVFPVFTGNTPQTNGPSKHVVAVWSGDVAGWTRFPLTVYGDVGTYLSLGTLFSGWETVSSLALTGAFRVA